MLQHDTRLHTHADLKLFPLGCTLDSLLQQLLYNGTVGGLQADFQLVGRDRQVHEVT